MDITKLATEPAIVGLVGALFGGTLSYLGSVHQVRAQHVLREITALKVVLLEVRVNQGALHYELDRYLPLHLTNRVSSHKVSEELREITKNPYTYNVKVFDTFFGDLLASRFGEERLTYYERITWLNSVCSKYRDGLPSEIYSEYVRKISNTLEWCEIMVPDLIEHTKSARLRNWGKEDRLSRSNDLSEEALLMGELARTNLQKIEAAFADEEQFARLPTRIRKTQRSVLENWLSEARRLMDEYGLY
jgi:hypothetical protein